MTGFKVRGLFFDRAEVIRAVDKARRQAMSRIGGSVRKWAQYSMKKRKGPSRPGTPPNVHAGQIKKFLYYAYDSIARSVVVGPVRIPGATGTAPRVLEEGGKTVRLNPVRVVKVRARPYMGPALENVRNMGGIISPWQDCIKP